MPVYNYSCDTCGKIQERIALIGAVPPICCGVVMKHLISSIEIRDSKSVTGKRRELWIERIDEIHKKQADRGERLRLPHPSEVV